MTLLILIGAPVLVFFVLGISHLSAFYMTEYNIKYNSIEFVILRRFVIWGCPFDEIFNIKSISFAKAMITPALHLNNKLFCGYVLIRKRTGLVRFVIITPNEPEEFVKMVQKRIYGSDNEASHKT